MSTTNDNSWSEFLENSTNFFNRFAFPKTILKNIEVTSHTFESIRYSILDKITFANFRAAAKISAWKRPLSSQYKPVNAHEQKWINVFDTGFTQ